MVARLAVIQVDERANEISVCGFGPSTGIYEVYDEKKGLVFMSRNVRFTSPSVGENRTETEDNSESDKELTGTERDKEMDISEVEAEEQVE